MNEFDDEDFDLLADHQPEFLQEMKNEAFRNKIVNRLAFSSDENAFKNHVTPPISEAMNEQLRNSVNQLYSYNPTPIPKTMVQALQEQDQAIVITEASPPFQIVHVNETWEGLCGYTLEECRGKTLSLLQGRDTDLSATTSVVSQLLRGEESGAVLTNYTKEGRRFRNHLRVGPLEGLFVGVLQEIHDGV